MFEKTREVIRKDRYGFPEEEFPHRVVIMGSPQAGLSRKELSLMTGCDPILAGDIQDNPSYDRQHPPSQDNFLFTVTVTVGFAWRHSEFRLRWQHSSTSSTASGGIT